MFRFSKTVVFLVRACIMIVGLESENLRFCSIEIYINTTNVLLAEKKFEDGEIYVTQKYLVLWELRSDEKWSFQRIANC